MPGWRGGAVPAKVEVRMALCVVRVKQALVRGDHQGGAMPFMRA